MSIPQTVENTAVAAGVSGGRSFTWVTAGTRPLAVRVDTPRDGRAVGAIVVAPSFDREAVVSFRATRALAAQAAEAGFVAYTFAWTGDQDSGPLQVDDDPSEVWVQDLLAVVAHARSLVGDDRPVHLVGVRLGAAVVAATPNTGPGDRVLWEPVAGRSFLRHHRLIRQSSVPVAPRPDGMELDGVHLTDEQVEGLGRLTISTRDPSVTVRKEPDRLTGLRLALGAPYFAHVPLTAVAEIVGSLPAGASTSVAAWTPQRSTYMSTPHGRVVETWCEVGPHRLPAILTEAAAQTPSPARVAVLFTAMGSEIKAGPGNVWTRLARELAAGGASCLRADRREIGDACDPRRSPEPRPYVRSAVDDVSAAADHLAATGIPVIGVGVCAGAWALGQSDRLSHVVAINVVHWNTDVDVYDEAFYRRYHGSDPLGAEAKQPPPGTCDDDDRTGLPPARGSWSTRTVHLLRQEAAIRFPRLRSTLRPDVPVDDVALFLRRLPSDLGVTLLFARQEYRIFTGKHGRRAVKRAQRRGMDLRVVVDDEMDHSLFSASGQEHASDVIRERCRELKRAPR